jgi:hypothetical protein
MAGGWLMRLDATARCRCRGGSSCWHRPSRSSPSMQRSPAAHPTALAAPRYPSPAHSMPGLGWPSWLWRWHLAARWRLSTCLHTQGSWMQAPAVQLAAGPAGAPSACPVPISRPGSCAGVRGVQAGCRRVGGQPFSDTGDRWGLWVILAEYIDGIRVHLCLHGIACAPVNPCIFTCLPVDLYGCVCC